MIIKARNVPGEYPLLVRYAVGGIYRQAAALADDGVTIPDEAQIIDIAFGGNGEPTVQVTFEPAWPDMLDAPREGLEARNAA